MKFTIASVGREEGPFAELVAATQKYGMRSEAFTSFDKCLAELLQDEEFDVVLIEHLPPEVNAFECAELLTVEHKLDVPVIGVVQQSRTNTDMQSNKSFNAGIFAILDGDVKAPQLAHTLFRACAQSKLLKLNESLFNDNQRLLEMIRTVDRSIEAARSEDDPSQLNSKALLDGIKGYDFSKEITKLERSADDAKQLFERVRKLGLKS